MAASVVFAERVGEQTPSFDGLALSVAATALLTLPLSVPAATAAPGVDALAAAIAVRALGVALPYALFFTALRRVGKRTYGVLLSLDAAVAAFAGFVPLGQGIGAAGMLGIGMVAASAGVVSATRG